MLFADVARALAASLACRRVNVRLAGKMSKQKFALPSPDVTALIERGKWKSVAWSPHLPETHAAVAWEHF